MCCFAANSLLCRLALSPRLIDPATFTSIRVLSASAILTMIVAVRRRHLPRSSPAPAHWSSTVALFTYLSFFSFAYDRLSTGTGALLLFGAVQFTMFVWAFRQGEQLPRLSRVGLIVAMSGFVYLVLPGANAPDALGAVLMSISGIAWGVFSLLARGSEFPLEANTNNFVACLPLAGLASLYFAAEFRATAAGIGLAVASGAIASGLGYAIWYAALRNLPRIHAATVQLSVPAFAAMGGVILLSETITMRLLAASLALLVGVALVLNTQVDQKAQTR
jgi:drug/metabolite transporter (DMT)-like permease